MGGRQKNPRVSHLVTGTFESGLQKWSTGRLCSKFLSWQGLRLFGHKIARAKVEVLLQVFLLWQLGLKKRNIPCDM